MSVPAVDSHDEEKALLPPADRAQATASSEDDYFATITLLLLLAVSLICSVVDWALFARAKSNQMVVDFAGNLVDAAAYVLSLGVNAYVKGRPRETKDSYEFRAAVLSTVLLYIVGANLGYMCYEQILCAMDTRNHVDGTLRCSFWLERPEPKSVIFAEFFKLCLYVSIAFLLMRGPYFVVIRKNVNLMSAILHWVVDFFQGVVFGIASLVILYTKKTETKVTIDAVASIFALLVLLISTVHMWKDHAFKRSDP